MQAENLNLRGGYKPVTVHYFFMKKQKIGQGKTICALKTGRKLTAGGSSKFSAAFFIFERVNKTEKIVRKVLLKYDSGCIIYKKGEENKENDKRRRGKTSA